MLKCPLCGHVERCCYVLCPVCTEPMIRIEEAERERVRITMEEKSGDPLLPEELKTQCKICGRRIPLYMITDYGVGDGLTLGVCKDCHYNGDL